MPLHFAAARSTAHSPIARALARKAHGKAANDNGGAAGSSSQPPVAGLDRAMRAALRHFGAHGLKAAETARDMAEEAFRAGDEDSYRWWLGICRTLDARLARQLESRVMPETALIG